MHRLRKILKQKNSQRSKWAPTGPSLNDQSFLIMKFHFIPFSPFFSLSNLQDLILYSPMEWRISSNQMNISKDPRIRQAWGIPLSRSSSLYFIQFRMFMSILDGINSFWNLRPWWHFELEFNSGKFSILISIIWGCLNENIFGDYYSLLVKRIGTTANYKLKIILEIICLSQMFIFGIFRFIDHFQTLHIWTKKVYGVVLC